MDALSDILRLLRLQSSLFCRAQLHSPWAVETSGGPDAIFHVIVEGEGHVRLRDGAERRAFKSGDIIVLPHGDAHVMADRAEPRGTPIHQLGRTRSADGLPMIEHGGFGTTTSIVCGSFRVDDDFREMLYPLLPPLLMKTGDRATASWLSGTLEVMAAEASGGDPGNDVVLTRLADIVVVQVLRSVIDESAQNQKGWLVALRDRSMGRALQLIHNEPAERWTVPLLAKRVGMSRSAFFRRFTELVGEPPAAYLSRWRMMLARSALARSDATVAEVAMQVGYASDAAFSKAFKRYIGISPADFRSAESRPQTH